MLWFSKICKGWLLLLIASPVSFFLCLLTFGLVMGVDLGDRLGGSVVGIRNGDSVRVR